MSTADPVEGVAFSPLQFIAVGTPPDENSSADLRHVLTVACMFRKNGDSRFTKLRTVFSLIPGQHDVVDCRLHG